MVNHMNRRVVFTVFFAALGQLMVTSCGCLSESGSIYKPGGYCSLDGSRDVSVADSTVDVSDSDASCPAYTKPYVDSGYSVCQSTVSRSFECLKYGIQPLFNASIECTDTPFWLKDGCEYIRLEGLTGCTIVYIPSDEGGSIYCCSE